MYQTFLTLESRYTIAFDFFLSMGINPVAAYLPYVRHGFSMKELKHCDVDKLSPSLGTQALGNLILFMDALMCGVKNKLRDNMDDFPEACLGYRILLYEATLSELEYNLLCHYASRDDIAAEDVKGAVKKILYFSDCLKLNRN